MKRSKLLLFDLAWLMKLEDFNEGWLDFLQQLYFTDWHIFRAVFCKVRRDNYILLIWTWMRSKYTASRGLYYKFLCAQGSNIKLIRMCATLIVLFVIILSTIVNHISVPGILGKCLIFFLLSIYNPVCFIMVSRRSVRTSTVWTRMNSLE